MASEWRWRTLGELTDNFDSIRVPVNAPDRRPGPYPYYGASGVVDNVDQYLYDGEYLLIAEDGENLRTRTTPVAFLARGRFWVNNHAHVVRGNSQADTRFLMYALAAADINGYLSGSAMPKLTQASLNRIPLFVPILAEQRRIADMLAALDDKIDLNRRMSRTLESMVRAYVDRAIANRPMVPYHTAVEVRMGAPFKGEGFSAPGNGRPLLRIRDLKTFASDLWTTEIRGDETVIRPGDIVVGMDAEFRAALWLGSESVLNQRVCTFRGLNGVGRAFVLCAMEPELAFQEQSKTGTTVIHLNKADIDTFMVPNMSSIEHHHLAATTEPLIDLVVVNSIQSRGLMAIRDALMGHLLSGRVQVPQEVLAWQA